MRIGLVTVTYNSGTVLKEFMESVLKQDHQDFILYVVDNDSADDTLEQLSAYKDERIKLIANDANLGVATGNNQGIEAGIADDCDYILLINNDTVFEESLLSKMLSVSIQKEVSMVTIKMMYHDEPNKIWYAGGFLNKWKGYKHNHRGINEEDSGQYDKEEIVTYAPTCCVLFRKEVFQEVGLVDDKYFVYFDDVDLFYRILIHGKHQLYYYPHVHFLHKEGSITKSSQKEGERVYLGEFFIKQNTKNQVYYLRKQKGLLPKFWMLYEYAYFNLRFFFSGKFKVNWSNFMMLQKAYFQGFRV
jgi:GT2 family glycosyltransferase